MQHSLDERLHLQEAANWRAMTTHSSLIQHAAANSLRCIMCREDANAKVSTSGAYLGLCWGSGPSPRPIDGKCGGKEFPEEPSQ
jgi:hypothetical protein